MSVSLSNARLHEGQGPASKTFVVLFNASLPRDRAEFNDVKTIIGGSLASLSAAAAAALRGTPSLLYLPAESRGSGFISPLIEGCRVDLGARSTELRPGAGPSPERYRPGQARAHSARIEDFIISDLGVPLVELPQAQVSFRGKLAPDFLATLDLSSLTYLLRADEQEQIKRELEACIWTPDGPLEVASLRSQGALFTELFVRSRTEKLLPGQWRDISAPLRNKLWATMLYPSTLQGGLEGRADRAREPLRFFQPQCGFMGPVVERMLEVIDRSPHVECRELPAHAVLSSDGCLRSSHGQLHLGPSLYIGLSLHQLLTLAGLAAELETMQLSVGWLEVDRRAVEVRAAFVNVFDAQNPVFRIGFGGSSPDPSKCVVSVEARAHSDEQRILRGCIDAGVLSADARGRWLRVQSVSMPIPNARNLHLVDRAKRRWSELKPVYLGSCLDLRHDTFNEQIVQGLEAAELPGGRLARGTGSEPEMTAPASVVDASEVRAPGA